MPAALIPAALSVGTSFLGGAGVVTALTYGGINAVLSIALSRSPSQREASRETTPRKHLLRSTEAPREIVYGTVRKSGLLTFAYSTGKNATLHLLVTLAGHEIDRVEELWLGKEIASLEKFRHHVSYTAHLGGDNQSADRIVRRDAPGWTQHHRGRGVAYIRVTLQWEPTLWSEGLPNISVKIRGKKLYDPRQPNTSPLYSANPALCVLDYLRSQEGLGCSDEEIDIDSFAAAASVCDQSVGTSRQKRYSCNGVVTLDQTPIDIIEQLLTSCGGVLVYTQGRYRMFASTPRSSSADLGEDNLRGDLTGLARPSRNVLFNTVRATYVEPMHDWQRTDINPLCLSVYKSQDGGRELGLDVFLPFTTNRIEAQRLARLVLEQNRPGARVRFPANLSALGIDVWDVVRLTVPSLGFSYKKFRVLSWRLSEDFGVDLELQEYSDAAYKDYQEDEIRPQPTLNKFLPDPFFRDETFDLVVFSALASDGRTDETGALASALVAEWRVPSPFIRQIELQWRSEDSSSWAGILLSTPSTHYEISNAVLDFRYSVRLRMVNELGVVSPWVTVRSYLFQSRFPLPPPPYNLSARQASDGTVHVSWEADAALYSRGKFAVRYVKNLDTSLDPEASLWKHMIQAHPMLLQRRLTFSFPAPEAGRYTIAVKSYNPANMPSLGTATALITLRNANIPTLPRSEASLGWKGPNDTGFVDEASHFVASSLGSWQDLPQKWSDLKTRWGDILPHRQPLVYHTPVIDLERPRSFSINYSMTGNGRLTCAWRHSRSSNLTSRFVDVAATAVYTRYFQLRVTLEDAEDDKPRLFELTLKDSSAPS